MTNGNAGSLKEFKGRPRTAPGAWLKVPGLLRPGSAEWVTMKHSRVVFGVFDRGGGLEVWPLSRRWRRAREIVLLDLQHFELDHPATPLRSHHLLGALDSSSLVDHRQSVAHADE